jgi:hypothetical protein
MNETGWMRLEAWLACVERTTPSSVSRYRMRAGDNLSLQGANPSWWRHAARQLGSHRRK